LATLAAFGALQIAVPYLLFARGLRSVPSQEASLIALMEPVLVPAWVLFALGNHETRWWTLVGGGLILLGLAWRYLPAAWAGVSAGSDRSAKA
jgi:drug/metabolite transporter (DMT)-like permease